MSRLLVALAVSDKGDQNSVSLLVHTSTIYIKVFLAAVIAMGVKFYIANVLCTLFCACMSLLTHLHAPGLVTLTYFSCSSD